MTTHDKLEFALLMGRHTRATVRQCKALMRYAGTLWRLERDHSLGSIAKRDRIRRKVTELCGEIAGDPKPREDGLPRTYPATCWPVFTGAVLKIRVPDGGEICVPS